MTRWCNRCDEAVNGRHCPKCFRETAPDVAQKDPTMNDPSAETATAAYFDHIQSCEACAVSAEAEQPTTCPDGPRIHVAMIEANDWTALDGSDVNPQSMVL